MLLPYAHGHEVPHKNAYNLILAAQAPKCCGSFSAGYAGQRSNTAIHDAGNLKGKSKVSGAHLLSSVLVPRGEGVPKYKSWSYLCQNEMAVEVGRKMFYTDSKGK
jgi:hypothetical protein